MVRSEDDLLGLLNDWERDHPGEAFGPALDQVTDELSAGLHEIPLATIRRKHNRYAKRRAALLTGHPELERVWSGVRRVEREFALYDAFIDAAKAEIDLRSRPAEPRHDADHSNELFPHSKDYRSVTVRGKTHALTPRQAQLIQILHEAYKNGKPDVANDNILEQLETKNSRWQDTFKSNPKAKRALIKFGERKGTLRLNL